MTESALSVPGFFDPLSKIISRLYTAERELQLGQLESLAWQADGRRIWREGIDLIALCLPYTNPLAQEWSDFIILVGEELERKKQALFPKSDKEWVTRLSQLNQAEVTQPLNDLVNFPNSIVCTMLKKGLISEAAVEPLNLAKYCYL